MMNYKFEEFHKGVENNNSVWGHFLRERNGQAAKCKACQKIIKCGGGSTTTLHTHLRAMHKINIMKRGFEDKETPSVSTASNEICSSKMKITNYFSNKHDGSLAAVMSRMAAKDGVPFSLFCTSDDLRLLLAAKGF